jgi:hypothetical protein
MVAVHTSVQRGAGIGGSAAARLSVDHGAPREHIAQVGEALAWHGGLTLDYLHQDGVPQYLECNPRTVEPGNAAASGVNLPALQIRLTLGETPPPALAVGRSGVRTHGTIALLLGAASRGESRLALMGEIIHALGRRSLYAHSIEQLTPVLRDPRSLIPAAVVAAQLLASPARATDIAAHSVASYSIDHRTLTQIARSERA